jgi:hypothetical protein
MKEIKNLYYGGYIIKDLQTGPKNTYRLYITCDANDGDYVRDTLDVPEDVFRDDLLFQYVLSYVAKGDSCEGKFGDTWKDDVYGSNVYDNEYFEWLGDYCSRADLLLFAGMIDDSCHSIVEIDMSYFDSNGIEHDIEIPDFDNLFETIDEAKEVMNYLHDNYLK